ncbi:DUF5829 family protein [Amycolatopsis thermoflava]|uniref:DUF5829 family protein n=1 Tax=Amycolatopsis thermoflava TaxID=84480 RepID=UPI003EBF14C0
MVLGFAGTAGATATAAGDRQLLYFNHAYGVIDRETADAVEHSQFLREFANFQVRTTTGGGQTWTARYVLGRETYLELFGVGDLAGQNGVLGAGGLAVSAERDGDLAAAAERLRALGDEPVLSLQTRDFGDGVPVPWFDVVFTSGITSYDAFGARGMEYRPEFFADPRSNTEPASYPGDVGRERVLPDDYAGHLMREVTAIRIGIIAGDHADTVPLLRAGGFAVRTTPHGTVATRGGTTIRLDVVPPAEIGLRSVEFSLSGAVNHRHVERIGDSELVVGPGPRAHWTFEFRD